MYEACSRGKERKIDIRGCVQEVRRDGVQRCEEVACKLVVLLKARKANRLSSNMFKVKDLKVHAETTG
ncbi:hypothetical protein PS1_007873 [Malus domestica]